MELSTTIQQDDSVLFRQCLLNSMTDGAVFLDRKLQVTAWNQRLERMTGLAAKNMLNQRYDHKMFKFRDPATGESVSEKLDPIALLLKSVQVVNESYRITDASNRELRIQLTATPVIDADQQFCGCVLLIHDDSAALNLQRQLRDLHALSILDPLTQVSNRNGFERAMDFFVAKHEQSNTPYSLIICDIDFFKQINDNYNHHIGDQALVAFAQLLQTLVSDRDVLARFGGEEFVILCDNCDLKDAASRAEKIRHTLNKTPMKMLDGKFITASFGVAELQPLESSTELFVRADTALIEAKETGRNRVVTSETDHNTLYAKHDSLREPVTDGLSWPSLTEKPIINSKFRTRTPISVLVEKLRGFIVEMDAELRAVESNHAAMMIEFEDPSDFSRKGRFEVRIDFLEDTEGENSQKHGRRTYTYLRITIRLAKRKWFSTNVPDLADDLLTEIRSYFMVNNDCDVVEGMQPATEHKERPTS
ncbi:diguanylate cyclase [Mariniblastus sp.]|nr:diguanylate cyclase [Mariniblastus sp.]